MRLDRAVGPCADETAGDHLGRRQDERPQAGDDDEPLPGEHEDGEDGTDRQPRAPAHDAYSGADARGADRRRSPALRVAEMGPDLAGGLRHGRLVEVGDRPRTGQVDRDVGHDAARTRRQDDDPIGDEDRLGNAVGDHHDRRRRPLPESEQLQVEPLAGQGVERAERLVEQQHLRLEGQRPGQRDPLTGAARQLRRPGRRQGRVESDQDGQGRQPFCTLRRGPAGQLQRVGDVVGGGAPGQESRLLEDEPDPRVRTDDRRAVQNGLAGDGSQQAGDNPQQGRFAAAVRADKGDDPAARDFEVDPVKDGQRSAGAGREREVEPAQANRARLLHPRRSDDDRHAGIPSRGRRIGAVAG